MEDKKSFWRSFNPTIKEMMEKHPNYSVLALWWSFTWRIYVILFSIVVAFGFLVLLFSLAFAFHS